MQASIIQSLPSLPVKCKLVLREIGFLSSASFPLALPLLGEAQKRILFSETLLHFKSSLQASIPRLETRKPRLREINLSFSVNGRDRIQTHVCLTLTAR